MRETWQLIGYAVGVTSVVISLALGTQYGLLEAAQYLPESSAESPASNRSAELASVEVIRNANVQPVWIVPTPKYQYDPRLMEVKPRHQLMKEVELRRAKELASFQAKKREAQLKS